MDEISTGDQKARSFYYTNTNLATTYKESSIPVDSDYYFNPISINTDTSYTFDNQLDHK